MYPFKLPSKDIEHYAHHVNQNLVIQHTIRLKDQVLYLPVAQSRNSKHKLVGILLPDWINNNITTALVPSIIIFEFMFSTLLRSSEKYSQYQNEHTRNSI